MPRFYFDLRGRRIEQDRTGVELPSWREARVEAARRFGAILRNKQSCDALGDVWRIEVTDEKRGLVIFRLDYPGSEEIG